MLVRMVQPQEVLSALHLVWEVYASDVAPLQNPEAVAGFQNFIKYDNIFPRIQSGEITLFGVWEENELCGVSGIDRRGNILLLYVAKRWQRRGAGHQLMQAMYQFCAQTLVITRVMIRAFPSAVTALNHLGMREVAPVQYAGPEVFVPMELMIAPGAMKPQKTRNKKVIALVAAGVVLCVALVILLMAMIYKEAKQVLGDPDTYYDEYGDNDWSDDWYDDWYGGDLYEEEEDSESGIDQIQEYQQENLPFEVTDESYLYSPDDTKTTYVDFEVYYPQLEGMEDTGVQDKVNEELKACAMETVDRIYDNPNTEIKERVLGEEYPVIADYVKYKVTYLTEDYLCVAFEDYSYEGSEEAYYIGLRTKNISLKDGTVYEVSDIVDLEDDFIDEWLDGMREEADEEDLLSELDTEEMRQALSGEDTKEGTYLPAFFAGSDGIEIGLSFHYAPDDENNWGYGWVTAPFDLDETEDYRTDSGFWELLK